ncbi:MAG: hypothetical protein WC589_20845, partial [Sphingobacterium sp.]
ASGKMFENFWVFAAFAKNIHILRRPYDPSVVKHGQTTTYHKLTSVLLQQPQCILKESQAILRWII